MVACPNTIGQYQCGLEGIVALVADNYGRKASSVLSRYKILEGKELEYLAYDMLDLTGQTYGTEVWQ